MRVVHVKRQLLRGLESLLTELASLDLLRLLLHLVHHDGFAEESPQLPRKFYVGEKVPTEPTFYQLAI